MTETSATYLVNSVSEGLVHRILEDLLSVLIRFVVHKSLVLINNILHWDSIAHLSIVRTGETYKQINSLSKLRQHVLVVVILIQRVDLYNRAAVNDILPPCLDDRREQQQE